MFDIPTRKNLQRLSALGRLSIEAESEFSELLRVHTKGGLQVRQQRKDPRRHLELSLINTSGGLTGGDALGWSIRANKGSWCTLSTPAAEKIYRSVAGVAKVDIDIDVGPDACLAWLPQETILFDEANFERNALFQIVSSSKLLITETLVLGRQASGETIKLLQCSDRWKVYSDGHLIHREDLNLNHIEPLLLNGASGLSGMKTITTLIYFGPDAVEHLPTVRHDLKSLGPNIIAACSAATIGKSSKLICRLIAPELYNIKACLSALVQRLNNKHLPKSWVL